MTLIALRHHIETTQLDQLKQEFPTCKFCIESELKEDPTLLSQAEILFSASLSDDELLKTDKLRWVHSPEPYIYGMQPDKLSERQDLILTSTKGQNVRQMAEYVLGAALGFLKNFFKSTRSDQPTSPTETLKDRILLQIGLDQAGTEITRTMRHFGMRVRGIAPGRSFHPFCDRTYQPQELHSILPSAHIVCLCLPRGGPYQNWFGAAEIKLMREGAVLIVLGSGGVIDESAASEALQSGHLRGVVVDAFAEGQRLEQSPLHGINGALLTPEISTEPVVNNFEDFRTFHYNLRHYLYKTPQDMRNVIDVESLRAYT